MQPMNPLNVPKLTILIAAFSGGLALAQTTAHPGSMRKIGEVDPQFISYNVEAVEVTGGRFWKPYISKPSAIADATKSAQNQPIGMDANLYQYRPPIDLSNPKLRKLAAALAPAYLRVSGTWRNTTYFQNNDEPILATAPEGFKGVMSRPQWKGVVDFSRGVGAELVISVATSGGTRDANGLWTPVEAKPFFDYTKSVGGKIVAAEFMNEPTFAMLGGVPTGYDAVAFSKDIVAFRAFLRKEAPQTLFLGPGSTGEGALYIDGMPIPKIIKTEDMLKNTGPVFDVFSYHFYGTVSRRCVGPKMAMTPEQALTPAFFDKNLKVEEFYAALRDAYVPGKPLWLTETGEAGCGGDPWASTFTDSLRYMDQLGSLAQRGVKTVMVNTLASSDYGLLDEDTLDPRPNFWSALLWKRLMGSRVLDPGLSSGEGLRVYAQCSKETPGSVTLLAINPGKDEKSLDVALPAQRYTLSTTDPLSKTVQLNGTELKTNAVGDVPVLSGLPTKAGIQRLPGLTVTFLKIPRANNPACR